MINPVNFLNLLQCHDISFFTGVPDSLLKSLCRAILNGVEEKMHITAMNEGGAIALAAGYHLATGKSGLVYMQNSGLGNAINPLLSLADPDVYSIPMVLVVGWRGEPGIHDEPQHIKQGAIQEKLLDSLGYPHIVLSPDEGEAEGQLREILGLMNASSTPVIIVVRKDVFMEYYGQQGAHESKMAPHQASDEAIHSAMMSREEALHTLIGELGENDRVVSTTGMISREIYEIREKTNGDHTKDFLTVGSMGHCSSISLALASFSRDENRKVWCIDGDGAILMHLGALALIGNTSPKNLVHVLINNGAHDSVGGQSTIGFQTDFIGIALKLGYSSAYSATTTEELHGALASAKTTNSGLCFIEIRVRKGARANLGRPKGKPIDNKRLFIENL